MSAMHLYVLHDPDILESRQARDLPNGIGGMVSFLVYFALETAVLTVYSQLVPSPSECSAWLLCTNPGQFQHKQRNCYEHVDGVRWAALSPSLT
jgi:hypothetical protein